MDNKVQQNEFDLILIMADKQKTRWMQDAGMFEKFKIIGYAHGLTLTLKPGQTLVSEVKRLATVLIEGGETVAAIFCPAEYDRLGCIYRNADIKVVSDGSRWCTVDKMVTAYAQPAAQLLFQPASLTATRR